MLQNDKQITISTAGSRGATQWRGQTLFWSAFLDKLRTPVRSTETLVEYLNYPKRQQDELKDVGGFVGGALIGGRRKAACVAGRDLIALDLDRIPAGGTEDVLRRVEGLGCAYAVYSTRKHEAARPRLRVLLPLHRTATGEEYEPLARKMAEIIGMGYADPTTFQAHRLMYWPSCCADSPYVFVWGDRPFLDTDGVLALYPNWRDVTAWPQCEGQEQTRNREVVKLGDPTEKPGIIGAFCRVYDVYTAMEELIPGAYEPCAQADRYTFTGGSTAGGALVYDEGAYLYSHHATDPAGGRLSNAFDLVRLHKFGTLDDNAKSDTPSNKLPSYLEMRRFAAADAAVLKLLALEDFGLESSGESTWESPTVAQEPPPVPVPAPESESLSEEAVDLSWTEQLVRDENGNYKNSINNTILLIQHAPELKGCAIKDSFANRIYTATGLPWRKDTGYWADPDTTELRAYLETRFKYKPGKQDVKDAIIAIAVKRQFHPVREYLEGLEWDGVPRLDTLFSDYLGVADTPYTRAVTRKSLVGAVARIMTPGCKFDYMPVFIGSQGRNKSTLLYKLAGGSDWFTDSIITFTGSQAFEAVTGKWLVEVPEMHAFDRVTMNQAKAFITKQSDFYRAAYAEFPEDKSRQCVFFGTTNNRECLRDETGGRRFWPLDIDEIPRKKSVVDDLTNERDQIWAEAWLRWSLYEPLYLDEHLEAVAAEVQEEHREAHPWEDTIADFLERKIPADWRDWNMDRRRLFWTGGIVGDLPLVEREYVCVREVWQEALGMSLAALDQSKARAIASTIVRQPGWRRGTTYRFGPDYGLQKCYRRLYTINS